MPINFAVFPYIRIKRTIKIGDFTIWTDNNPHWKKYLNTERPKNLLKIYRDRNGKILKHMVIVSNPNGINLIKFSELVSILYFLPSIKTFFSTKSESFYFDTYIKKDTVTDDSSHSRIDKFVYALVDNRGFKIYQTPESDTYNFTLDNSEHKYFSKLKKHFLKNTGIRIIKSLPFYFRTQYRNPSYFPEIEDVQNFSTAFEILYEIGDSRNKKELIAQKLYDHFISTSTENRQALYDWFISFYKIRSSYTHGDDVEKIDLNYLNQRQIDIAKQIYREAIKKLLLKPRSKFFRGMEDDSTLTRIFMSQSIYDDILLELSPNNNGNGSGQKNLEKILNYTDEELAKLERKVSRFYLYADRRIVVMKSKVKLRNAMRTLTAIVKVMLENYDKLTDKSRYFPDYLDELRSLPLDAKDDISLEKIYDFFNHSRKYTKAVYDSQGQLVDILDELKLKDILSISTISNLFTNLHLIYKDLHNV